MKKSFILLAVISLVLIMCSCNTGRDDIVNSSGPEVSISDSAANNTAATQENPRESRGTHFEYSHSAIEGCVIVKSDTATGKCVYKTKCPVCGNTSSSTVSAYLKSGTLSTGASCTNVKCPNHGERFNVIIESSAKSVDN